MHKLSKLSELANILSVKSEVRANILALFSRFGMGPQRTARPIRAVRQLVHLRETSRRGGKDRTWGVVLCRAGKMGNTKYKVAGKLHCAAELIALHERTDIHECRKYKCLYISLRGTLGSQQVRIFLIRYGHNQRWNVLLTSDVSMPFVKAFEVYQIRWNIEVLNKEAKQYLGLGSCQGRDFDGQVADCTICFITYIVMALEKRFSDYETMGELFAGMEDDVAALTLWRRMLECIRRLLDVLCRHLGITVDELAESIINDDEVANDYFIMAKALEDSKSAQ